MSAKIAGHPSRSDGRFTRAGNRFSKDLKPRAVSLESRVARRPQSININKKQSMRQF